MLELPGLTHILVLVVLLMLLERRRYPELQGKHFITFGIQTTLQKDQLVVVIIPTSQAMLGGSGFQQVVTPQIGLIVVHKTHFKDSVLTIRFQEQA